MAEPWEDGPARRLDRLLEAAGVRNVDLATELELDQSTISKYRSGERQPRAYELAYMVERAHGSADEVLGLRPWLDPAATREMYDAAVRVTGAAPQLAQAQADKKRRGR